MAHQLHNNAAILANLYESDVLRRQYHIIDGKQTSGTVSDLLFNNELSVTSAFPPVYAMQYLMAVPWPLDATRRRCFFLVCFREGSREPHPDTSLANGFVCR